MSVNRSCELVSISKTAYYYKSKKCESNKEIEEYLKLLAKEHKRWGFNKMMLKAKARGKALESQKSLHNILLIRLKYKD